MTGDRFPNETMGGVMAAAGATGGTWQILTDVAGAVVIWGNAVMVICGLVLMAPRLWRLCRRRKRQ